MSATYYLDESGNEGDLASAGRKPYFVEQPIFSLACVGWDDDARVSAELQKLKFKHQIDGELKSSRLINKLTFVRDLILLLREVDARVFIELLEKRYSTCIYIAELLAFPGPPGGYDQRSMIFKNSMAEFFHAYIPDTVIGSFFSACQQPSFVSVRASMATLIDWLAEYEQEGVRAIAGGVKLLLDELDEAEESGHREHYLQHLPSPEVLKKGKSVWMLPNLSCLTNIYARLRTF